MRRRVSELLEILQVQNFVRLELENSNLEDDENEFLYFCHESLITDFKAEKSTFLEEAFDLMQQYDDNDKDKDNLVSLNPITPDQIVKLDTNNNTDLMNESWVEADDFDITDGVAVAFNLPSYGLSSFALSTGERMDTGSSEVNRKPSSDYTERIFQPPSFLNTHPDTTGSAQIVRQTTASRQIYHDSQTTNDSTQTQTQTQSQTQSQMTSTGQSSTPASGQPVFDRQDSNSNDGLFIIRNNGGNTAWDGVQYEIRQNRNNTIPKFDVEMPAQCDVLLLTSHIGNEKSFSSDFQEYIELVVKQIGLTRRTNATVDALRQRVLAVTNQVIYVIKEQLRVFDEIRNAIHDAHDHNKQNNIEFNYHENLEYLEREYPEAIRRIYRSFNKYFQEIKKLAKKPFSCNLDDQFFIDYQKLVLQVFYDWIDFELEKMKDLTLKYKQDLHKNIRFGPANFQRQFLESRFLEKLDNPEMQKYKEYLETIETVFQNESKFSSSTRLYSNNRISESPSTGEGERDINSNVTFVQRARKQLDDFDRKQQKKYSKLLDYGKVQGGDERLTNSDRFQKTYQGKQVNFKYDIRKKCGQVSYTTTATVVGGIQQKIFYISLG